MSKSSTASAQKIPPQLPTKSAWAKGPPPNTSAAGTPRSQSPASGNATPPTSANHSRRPSALGQGIPIKDGVSVPRSTVGAAKQSTLSIYSGGFFFPARLADAFLQDSVVSFGSIDDASPPISSSPAVATPVKPDGVKASGHVNGKPSISKSSANHPPPNGTAITATSATPAPAKPMKMDIHKLFQGSSSSSQPPDAASPSTRPSNLPPQQPHHLSQQQQAGKQSQQSSQPPQLGAHSFGFVPTRPSPPQQQNSGPVRGPSGSPVYPRQPLTNGAGGRPPGGPNGGPPMSAAMSSPRLGPHPGQQQPGMPQQPMPVPGWPSHYVSSIMGDICLLKLIICLCSTNKIRICSLTTEAGMYPDPRCRISNFLNTIRTNHTIILRPDRLVNPTQACQCLLEPNLHLFKDRAHPPNPTQYQTQSIRRLIHHPPPTRTHIQIALGSLHRPRHHPLRRTEISLPRV